MKARRLYRHWPRISAALLETALLAFAFLAAASPPVITNPPTAQTIFLGDPATFRVVASGTAPLSYQWLRNGVVISAAVASNLSFTTAATDHNVQFSVVVTNVEGAVSSAPVVLTIDFGEPGPPQTNRWIEITNIWLYNVSQGDLGTAWTAPGYPDAAWASGGGLLYVEDSPLPAPMTTALPLTAGGLPTTCYFRTRFTNNLTNAYSLNVMSDSPGKLPRGYSSPSTVRTMFSGVKPKCSKSCLAGAEAPKLSMPMTAPLPPT